MKNDLSKLNKKDASILKAKKIWLFDMDGTIYLGNKIFDGTLDLLSKITETGGKYIFVTNNSSKGKPDYLRKVRNMGIDADESRFYTSVDASVVILKEKFKDKLIYVQGTKSFVNELIESGLNVTDVYDEKAECVIVGFDAELTMQKLTDTCKMLLKDLPYYATNPDWVCPTEFGYVPDCGSMCFGIEKATGKKPIFIGKPSPLMIENALKSLNCKKEDAVVIGDRLYTDIASGVNANVDSVLVLSGESTLETLSDSEVKPTFVFENVRKISDIL